MQELIEDVDLSFKLFEFAIRTKCYAELERFDTDLFGQGLQLNLSEENISFSSEEFKNKHEIIWASQMAVGATFGSTAICLDCLLEKVNTDHTNMSALKSLIAAVRNAFSHGIAAPSWYIKPHKYEKLDLSFIDGPKIDLEQLNGKEFEYSHIGGLAVWYRVKDYVIANI